MDVNNRLPQTPVQARGGFDLGTPGHPLDATSFRQASTTPVPNRQNTPAAPQNLNAQRSYSQRSRADYFSQPRVPVPAAPQQGFGYGGNTGYQNLQSRENLHAPASTQPPVPSYPPAATAAPASAPATRMDGGLPLPATASAGQQPAQPSFVKRLGKSMWDNKGLTLATTLATISLAIGADASSKVNKLYSDYGF